MSTSAASHLPPAYPARAPWGWRGETASVFLPSVPALLGFAGEMEMERDHVLDRPARDPDQLWAPEEALVAAANRSDPPVGEEPGAYQALEAEAAFDRVLYDGGEFGTGAAVGSAEEEDFLGLPGLLDPDQVTALLSQRQARQQARGRRRRAGGAPAAGAAGSGAAGSGAEQPALSRDRALALLRAEQGGLVGAWHHRTGQPHGAVHATLRRACGGPPSAQAGAEHLQERIATLRRWAAEGRRLA